MPEIVVDPPAPTCSHLNSKSRIEVSQPLGIDPSLPRARDARGRFAKGHSGNPRGRPPGIPNPKRRIPDLIARPLSAQALVDLLDRKPHLLLALADQLLPPPRTAIDPAKRLGIDLSSMRTAEDIRWVMPTVLAAISRGEITPAEGADIARRVRAWRRWVRKLARAGSVNQNKEKQPADFITKSYVAGPAARGKRR
jgi:Family of unknown function (DUF5681)